MSCTTANFNADQTSHDSITNRSGLQGKHVQEDQEAWQGGEEEDGERQDHPDEENDEGGAQQKADRLMDIFK